MAHKKKLFCERLKHKWEWKEVRVTEMKKSGRRAQQKKYVCSRCGKVLAVRQPMPARFYEQEESTGPFVDMFKNCRLEPLPVAIFEKN